MDRFARLQLLGHGHNRVFSDSVRNFGHKTGGLEAAIAIHTINNYFAFAQQVFIVIEDPDTIPWEAAVFDMVSTTITVVLVYLCVRKFVSVSTPPHPNPASLNPNEC